MTMDGDKLNSDFYKQYRGSFSGILKWPDLDELWNVLRKKAVSGWFVYAIGQSVPDTPLTDEQLSLFINEINKLLRKEHQEEYCGVVYVDDHKNPSFIKIYNPNKLGVSCGFSDNPPLPGWIISIIKPELLDENTFMSKSRQRWWHRIFSNS